MLLDAEDWVANPVYLRVRFGRSIFCVEKWDSSGNVFEIFIVEDMMTFMVEVKDGICQRVVFPGLKDSVVDPDQLLRILGKLQPILRTSCDLHNLCGLPFEEPLF